MIRFPILGMISCGTRLINHSNSYYCELGDNGWQCGVLKRSGELVYSLPDEFVLIVLVFFRGFPKIMFGIFGSDDCDCLWALAKVGLPGRDLIWTSWTVSCAESKDKHAT